MRRTWVLGCVLLIAALAPAGALRAQQAVVLVFEGWSRSVSSQGVVAYACGSSGCPAGARVSYKRQPHRPELDLARFEAHHARLARDAPAASQGRVREASVTGFSEHAVEGVRVLSGLREVTWSDGTRSAAVDALLIGPSASYSVVSDADERQAAQADFAHFLPRLVDLVLVSN